LNPKDNILIEKNRIAATGLDANLHSEERLFPPGDECSELSIACYRADFSASRISHAVEDADAHLLNLNVTSEVLPSGQMVIDLRVSHRDAGAVSRSLDRYGFTTIRIRQGSDSLADSMADRIGQLLAQIQV